MSFECVVVKVTNVEMNIKPTTEPEMEPNGLRGCYRWGRGCGLAVLSKCNPQHNRCDHWYYSTSQSLL